MDYNHFKRWYGFYTINKEQENLVHLNKNKNKLCITKILTNYLMP